MSPSIRRLLRLGYEVKFSIAEGEHKAYAVSLTRDEFHYQHLIDKVVCDASFCDGLAIEIQRLTRMMENHSHFHGDKPIGAKQ